MCRNAISVCFRPVFDPSSKMLLAHMFYHLFLVIAELHVYPPDSATSASCFNFSIVNQRLFIPYSLICCRMDLLCSLTPSYLLKVILVCCFQRLDVWMFGRDRPCGGGRKTRHFAHFWIFWCSPRKMPKIQTNKHLWLIFKESGIFQNFWPGFWPFDRSQTEETEKFPVLSSFKIRTPPLC